MHANPTPDHDPKRWGSRWSAIGALLVVTVIWGGTFVWMKQALEASLERLGSGAGLAGIALFMFLRFGLAAVCLALFVPSARRELTRGVWTGGFWIGLVLFGGFVLQMMGLEEVSPAVSAFLTSLYVLFTALITAGRNRRGPSLALIVGVVLATLGAGFIRGRPELAFNTGELLTVGCAVMFAVHILVTDHVTKRVPAMAVTLTTFVWVSLGGALLLAASALAGGGPGIAELLALTATPAFAVPLVLSSLLATVLALSLMNLFQRRLDPVRAAILYAFEPIWAALFGIAAGTDRFSTYLWLGGGLLLAGNLIAEVGQRWKERMAARA
jgi:drug/metabolite transporter (DMT)-like permease